MKRILAGAVVAVLATIGAPAGAAPAATQSRNFSFGFSSGSSYVFMHASATVDLLTGAVTGSNVLLQMSTSSGYEEGNGPGLTLDFDPLMLRGTISGTVAGRNGPIAVSLSFTATEASTNLPYGSVEVIPAPPGVRVVGAPSRNGRTNGTVAASIGAVAVTNAYSNAYAYTEATA